MSFFFITFKQNFTDLWNSNMGFQKCYNPTVQRKGEKL